MLRFLADNCDVKLLIAACNTISARALDHLARFFVPILGVIEPVLPKIIQTTRNKRVGVIGTHSTITSGVYQALLRKLDPDIQVFAQECGLFMPLVEEGWQNEPAARMVAESYLQLLKYAKIDTLVLACTHYPVLAKVIAEVMGEGVILIDPAIECVKRAKEFLAEHNLQSKAGRPDRLFYVTDKPEAFKLVGERYLDRKINNVSLVEIDVLERSLVSPPLELSPK